MSRKPTDYTELAAQIRAWSAELGFQQTGISDIELGEHAGYLDAWLARGYHGEMAYMQRHGDKRSRPELLVPGTLRVISVRMNYLPPDTADCEAVLAAADRAYISRYALGRDYHKLMRKRLQQLADRISEHCEHNRYRVFVDSAPVLEKALAQQAGLGWIGKHTNLLNRDAGSWFFLGELYTNLPLPADPPQAEEHCGDCTACIDICPTQAIIAPYQLDARRCISYLTIELRGSIPLEFRRAIGNRIYGCDDCQLVCPWNRFARTTGETGFHARDGLDDISLLALFDWDEATFLQRMAGSAIRRIGYDCWQRNIAVALGNAGHDQRIIAALQARRAGSSDMVQEHIDWALAEQRSKTGG